MSNTEMSGTAAKIVSAPQRTLMQKLKSVRGRRSDRFKKSKSTPGGGATAES
jgi:hypothetical protein